MDAVRVAAVLALLTSIAAAGCSEPLHQPAGMPPPPAYVQRVATLRVGLPSLRRGSLLFSCNYPSNEHSTPHLGSASYTADSLDPSGRRWLRAPGAAAGERGYALKTQAGPDVAPDSAVSLAPDTLIVRAFTDATDEEIALERGDLDVAVFWPGEVSARMRADSRFRDPDLGVRERGLLVCLKSAADSLGPPRADMEMLNREAFGGDLLPWSDLAPDSADGRPVRYTVDSVLPGAKHLERVLARIPTAGATRTMTLKYLDMPGSAFKTPVPDARPDLRQLVSVYRPLFVIRCAVLAAPGARAAVRRIGADAFAQMAPRAAIPQSWDPVRGIYR